MSFADLASLATAVLQLAEVQDVIGAIQAADKAVAAFEGVSSNTRFSSSPAATFEPRLVLHPDLCCCLPRPAVHPAPVYPRPIVYHPTIRIESEIPPAAADPEQPPRCSPPWMQPPWKILPWETPVPPRPIIKLIRYQPDIPNKGDLLDVFL